MTLKRYNLYTTQHQKHLQRITKQLLTLLMNIILCEYDIIKKHYFIFCPHGGREDKIKNFVLKKCH